MKCPHCGIDESHETREDCIRALKELDECDKDRHRAYRRRISKMVTDKLEEVVTARGAVIGYKLNLTADETERLCRAIESP